MSAALFDGFDPVPAPQPVPLSADRRRTIRNNESLARGVHPVTRVRLLDRSEAEQAVRALRGHPPLPTCGDCTHLRVWRMAKTYIKCALNDTGSAATDVRKKWPACEKWEAS